MIRVLHVIDSLDLGGAQAVVVNLARFRDQEKFDVAVAAMHGRGVFAERLEAEGVRVISLSGGKLPPLYLLALPSLLRRERFDVVHFHLFGSNWIAKPLAVACGVRVRVNHDHCNDRSRTGWRLLADRLTNRWSSHVLAVSHSTADDVIRRVGVPASRVTCLPNGVDTARFYPAGLEEREVARAGLVGGAGGGGRGGGGGGGGGGGPAKVLVAGLGRLHPQKNWPLFLAVAREFSEVEFVIAGTGPEEARLRAAAGGNVRFVGFRDPAEVLAAADVFLLTSDYEGMPMTLLEAMSCGVAPVVSAVDGCRDILGDGAGGLMAEAGNVGDFAAKLGPLIASAEERTALGSAARDKVLRTYDARAQTAVVEALYRKLLTA
jgi:glycosyltransferase involved in cell wall biosynthesis